MADPLDRYDDPYTVEDAAFPSRRAVTTPGGPMGADPLPKNTVGYLGDPSTNDPRGGAQMPGWWPLVAGALGLAGSLRSRRGAARGDQADAQMRFRDEVYRRQQDLTARAEAAGGWPGFGYAERAGVLRDAAAQRRLEQPAGPPRATPTDAQRAELFALDPRRVGATPADLEPMEFSHPRRTAPPDLRAELDTRRPTLPSGELEGLEFWRNPGRVNGPGWTWDTVRYSRGLADFDRSDTPQSRPAPTPTPQSRPVTSREPRTSTSPELAGTAPDYVAEFGLPAISQMIVGSRPTPGGRDPVRATNFRTGAADFNDYDAPQSRPPPNPPARPRTSRQPLNSTSPELADLPVATDPREAAMIVGDPRHRSQRDPFRSENYHTENFTTGPTFELLEPPPRSKMHADGGEVGTTDSGAVVDPLARYRNPAFETTNPVINFIRDMDAGRLPPQQAARGWLAEHPTAQAFARRLATTPLPVGNAAAMWAARTPSAITGGRPDRSLLFSSDPMRYLDSSAGLGTLPGVRPASRQVNAFSGPMATRDTAAQLSAARANSNSRFRLIDGDQD